MSSEPAGRPGIIPMPLSGLYMLLKMTAVSRVRPDLSEAMLRPDQRGVKDYDYRIAALYCILETADNSCLPALPYRRMR